MREEVYFDRKKAPNIKTIVLSELGDGLNEVFPPLNIRDGQLAKCRNFYTPDGVTLRTIPCDAYSNPYPLSATEDDYGIATFNGIGSNVLPLMFSSADGSTYKAARIQGATGTVYDVSSNNFLVSETLETRGAVEFITQSAKFSIYWSELMNALMVQNQSTKAVTLQALPSGVYPKNVISHRTRLYLLDTNNTIWWCNAGDYTEWYGETVTAEYQAIDAGYWFVDAGQPLHQIVSFGQSIYVFGDSIIYRFSGYEDNNFVLDPMFKGIGTYPYYEHSVCVSGDTMYFTSKGKVYQYNGSDYPVIISEPEIVNGNISNGIMGGVTPSIWDGAGGLYEADWEFRSIVATLDKLYLYSRYTQFKTIYSTSSYYTFIPAYVFDIRHRSWWMQDFAFYDMGTVSGTYAAGRLTIIPAVGTDGTIAIAKTLKRVVSTNSQQSNISNICFTQTTRAGVDTTTVHGTSYYCWFESKAFATRIDGKFKLYEVDVVWRYVGTLGDKKEYMALSWNRNADNARTSTSYYAGWYITGSQSATDTLQVYQNSDWDSNWSSTDYAAEYGSSHQDDWQQYPINAKWRVDQYAEEYKTTPFVRLLFLTQYGQIEIQRIELKYRAVGASK